MTSETPVSPAPPSLAGAEWLVRPETQAVLAMLEHGGYSARAVGGCVRNALLGVPVKDIDIATTAPPEEVIALARAAHLKAVPTGLAHGTITIVAHHIPYEVTTLREDVETFGRHARVAFTGDWAADARRRDFTMNALYCSADGTVHDPLGGYGDLAARRVRFIGDAVQRIREDYLRILRFYRLHAQYGEGALDETSHGAAIRERAGLARLSGERIHGELSRLIAAPGAVPAITDLAECGILQLVLGTVPRLRALERLAGLERKLGLEPNKALRLAALSVSIPEEAVHLKERLKISTAEFETLLRAATRAAGPSPVSPPRSWRAAFYRLRVHACRQAVLIDWARGDVALDDAACRALWELAVRWQPPPQPLRGADVLALGVPAGPRVGRIMKAFEDWWVGADFPTDPVLLAERLIEITANN